MLLVFRDARYLVLGIAVAQIDPLSVAAMRANSRMSARAKALLFAWASFDDPVTVLLSLYFSILAFRLSGRDGSPRAGPSGDGLGAYLTDLGSNLALAAAAFVVFVALRGLRKPAAPAPGPEVAGPSARRGAETGGRFADLLSLAVLPVVFLVAAQWMLMPAVAVIGLFLRVGAYAKVVDRAVATAFLVASFALGLLLLDGVDLLPAVVLGVAAGIVAPAILVVNVLHYASNGVLNRYAGDPPHPPADEPGGPGTSAFRPGALSGAAPASGPPDARPSPETGACATAPGADPET